jgi:hypothetical protein
MDLNGALSNPYKLPLGDRRPIFGQPGLALAGIGDGLDAPLSRHAPEHLYAAVDELDP